MPKYNSISISGYHMQEAGATSEIELAYTLADGIEYVKTGLAAGLKIDDFAPRLSFFWGIGMNHFREIAKMRAGRMLWAKMMKAFDPKINKSLALRAHCQTSGWSLTAQDPFNNVARTNIAAMAAVFGGTQSLHTNALDEAIALPTDFSSRIARNNQLFLQEEAHLTNTVDPWGGSEFVENLTNTIANEAWSLIQEIETYGGMAKAIEAGIPKMRIEQAAAIKQARIDSGQDHIIGLNRYELEEEEHLDFLEVDNIKVTKQQLARLKSVKQNRNEAAAQESLIRLKNAAFRKMSETEVAPDNNLLDLSIDAARKRATLGEISSAIEEVFGKYQAKNQSFTGVYSKAIKDDPFFKEARELLPVFEKKFGRNPRIMIAKMGQDGHDRGAKVIASAYADLGFDVDIGPLFQTPEEAAKQAVENDVHVLGVSSLAAGHKTLVPQLINALAQYKREDISVIVGGVIPVQDHEFLIKSGVLGIYGPGTKISKAAFEILNLLLKKYTN